jgi:hypothetical protein
MLPWALQRPMALVFDEYDAGRPDVMFVIQRVLEVQGKLTLLDQNRVIRPHPAFRLFSTTNTIGLGDTTGLYHGTQQINQGQMDRWNIVTTLNYLPHDVEAEIVLAKAPQLSTRRGQEAGFGDGARGRHDPQRLHQRRSLHRHEPAHGDHLGRERRDLRRYRRWRSADLPQQMRRARARRAWPSSTSAASATNCRNRRRRPKCWWHERKPENPAEPFKRAVACAVRSLAGEPELEVNFSAEPPALKGLKARLPLPSRNLPPSEVAIVRGAGRRLCAAPRLSRRCAARTIPAAIGRCRRHLRSRRTGARRSDRRAGDERRRRQSAAQLEARCNARGLAKARDRSEAPLADAWA